MSTLTLTVTQGYTWPLTGTIFLDPTKMNLLATPVVVGTLTGAIQAEDLQDNSVPTRALQDAALTLVKLAAEVAALLPVPVSTVVNDADGTGQVTIQMKSPNGVALANRYLVRIWTSASTYGAVAAITGLSPTTGTVMRTITANGDLEVQSDASGTIIMDFNNGGAGTRYLMAEIDGRIYSTQVTITA